MYSHEGVPGLTFVKGVPPLFLSVALLLSAFPPLDFGWTAWFAFLPWLSLLSKATPRQAFVWSYWIGFLFFLVSMSWLRHVSVVGGLVLVAVLGLFFALWGWYARHVLKHFKGLWAVLLLAAAWMVQEYIQGHLFTGLGWNLLGHTQWHCIDLIQIADVFGVYGVSFVVVFFSALLYAMICCGQAGHWRRLGVYALVGGVLVGACLGYGHARSAQVVLERDIQSQDSSWRVAVVQGNIPQDQKWDGISQDLILEKYTRLSLETLKDKPDLIIWPETAIPVFLDSPWIQDYIQLVVEELKVPLLAGIPDIQEESSFNTVGLWQPKLGLVQRYDKIHLVPFGEFIPFHDALKWLTRFYPIASFVPGTSWTVFDYGVSIPGGSVLICFEDLFPEMARRFVREGAQWLTVVTNDAWFGESAAGIQHLQASVFRAVENKVWIARAANNGWSGFIDPLGQRLTYEAVVPRFEVGTAVAELDGTQLKTLYTVGGDWAVFLGMFVVLFTAILPKNKGRG